jgi:hypothetical protein
MAIFTQLPVWYISVFIVKRREWADRQALINSLPNEFKDLIVPSNIIWDIKQAITWGFTPVFALYIQQVDVSLILIKKWLIERQQNQLNSYFMSQKDAVILYTTNT